MTEQFLMHFRHSARYLGAACMNWFILSERIILQNQLLPSKPFHTSIALQFDEAIVSISKVSWKGKRLTGAQARKWNFISSVY